MKAHPLVDGNISQSPNTPSMNWSTPESQFGHPKRIKPISLMNFPKTRKGDVGKRRRRREGRRTDSHLYSIKTQSHIWYKVTGSHEQATAGFLQCSIASCGRSVGRWKWKWIQDQRHSAFGSALAASVSIENTVNGYTARLSSPPVTCK